MTDHMRPLTLPVEQNGIDPGRFRFWLDSAPPGAAYIYHVGFLLKDRGIGEKDKTALPHKMGDLARASHLSGVTVLLQKRLGPGRFVYLAMKRRGVRHEEPC